MSDQKIMRDPLGNLDQYSEFFLSAIRGEAFLKENESTWDHQKIIEVRARRLPSYWDVAMHQYASGLSLQALEHSIAEQVEMLLSLRCQFKTVPEFSELYPLVPKWMGCQRRVYGFLSLALLLSREKHVLESLGSIIPANPADREYFFDLMCKAFVPSILMLKKYSPARDVAPYMAPLLRALALPASERSASLAAHMAKWEGIMRPWGLKPNLNTVPGHDNLFCDFAFEVALAVCVYDIDDSSFCEHRYYPRDLVEHYRTHVRHTRDAWRAPGVGPGVAIEAPPPPLKANLAKSKRKGIARLVELVSDGDSDAVDQVLEEVGKPKKLKDIDSFMSALAEADQAIRADIKDDDTLEAQAGSLALTRSLGDFLAPDGPPYGPARCAATLLAFGASLSAQNYRLLIIDTDDGTWHAVLVRAEFHAELLELGGQLGLVMLEPEDAFHT